MERNNLDESSQRYSKTALRRRAYLSIYGGNKNILHSFGFFFGKQKFDEIKDERVPQINLSGVYQPSLREILRSSFKVLTKS